MRETRVQSLGQEDPLEKEMKTHSSTLAWKIQWMEEPGGLSPWGRKLLDTTERLHFHFHFHRHWSEMVSVLFLTANVWQWQIRWVLVYFGAQFSSVAQLCLTLCDPMDCSTLGFPVHHQLPEPTQTHVQWVGDAIQPSHPLLSPSSHLQSFPASESFQLSQFFTSGSQSIGVSASASVLSMNIQDWFP